MRIVIDMQGVQASNSKRGIGRYTLSLVKSILRNNSRHELILVLNSAFPDSIYDIRNSMIDLLSVKNIKVWSSVTPISYLDNENTFNRKTAELIREAFIANLNPDVVLITSLFEGLGDNAVTSVKLLPTNFSLGVVLYDLIPFIYRKPYLENKVVESWYLEKIQYLKKADFYLGISESSCQEGIKSLGLAHESSTNISTDADYQFKNINVKKQQEQALRDKYQLIQPFVMYTGGIDHRKNIEGLIGAFAKLPPKLYDNYQLVIVCSIQHTVKKSLTNLVLKVGLKKQQVVFTGYVPEEDLILLYNITHLFVFPSWHEGFGLPLLEAMRCGAPAISSNLSSLPEVIGWESAQFDPHDEQSMADLIEKSLTNTSFHQQLIDNAIKQSKNFSWDETAQRALRAMKKAFENKNVSNKESLLIASSKPKLAYISPLPPEKSGIADYSAELIPYLAKFYDIHVIVNQKIIENEWINQHCTICTVEYFTTHSETYERVLYHFGNSSFHEHMFGLLYQFPGVVVLHDFFLGGVINYIDASGIDSGMFTEELYQSHGYKALLDYSSDERGTVIWKYPMSFSVIQNSKGVIVHSRHSLNLPRKWYGLETKGCSVIPLLRVPRLQIARHDARKALNFSDDAFVICSFGVMGVTKLNDRLLFAWLNSNLAKNKKCYLVFVGQNCSGGYGVDLLERIRKSKLKKQIIITGWVDQDTYHQYLAVADIGVQLRALSRGETSAAVLDCMNYGVPTIVNANGSMADLDPQSVWMLPDEFEDKQLINVLETLYNDKKVRHNLSTNARNAIVENHNPVTCALAYRDAIEGSYTTKDDLERLLRYFPKETLFDLNPSDLKKVATNLSYNFPHRYRHKQLLVDISELVQRDSKSGIQRVVKSILKEWLVNSFIGLRVEPVYFKDNQGFFYAREFTTAFLGIDCVLLDKPVDVWEGDYFLALDLQHHILQENQNYFRGIMSRGVVVKAIVYDLLPLLLPQMFVEGARNLHQAWLETTSKLDGVICISKTVANEYRAWLAEQDLPKHKNFSVDWFHLGADIKDSNPSIGLPQNARFIIKQLEEKLSFLMVGTIEPRKGYTQTLCAFDLLWKEGYDINLILVGKQGWLVDELVERLHSHSELNKRLFLLKGVSDEFLEEVYSVSTCLIAASYSEGFGLPLIEAAQKKIPVIARDIAVFKEVAGEYAYYFSDHKNPQVISRAIADWLQLYKNNQHPKSDYMPWLTWKQSAQNLLNLTID